MLKRFFSVLAAAALSWGLLAGVGCAQDVSPESIIALEREVEPVGRVDLSEIDAVPKEQSVTIGEIMWQIQEARDLGPAIVSDEFAFEAKTGKIIQLDFLVLNLSEEVRTLYDLNIIDDQGRVFSICLPAYGLFSPEKACALQVIVPEVEYDFIAPFDIAVDSEGLILEVTDLKTPAEQKAYIDLGI